MSEARAQLLFDLFTTAIEGSINYWAQVQTYHHWSSRHPLTEDVTGFYADVIEEAEDGVKQVHRINAEVMSLGLERAFQQVVEGKIANDYQRKAIVFAHLAIDDGGDFDADTADMVVQCGLFGTVVYA